MIIRNSFFCVLGVRKCRQAMWIDPLGPDDSDSGPEVIEVNEQGDVQEDKKTPLAIQSPYVRSLSDKRHLKKVVHLVVIPNYKEPESVLRQTLLALSQTKRSRALRVVLGCEEREEEAPGKAARLKEEFQDFFSQVIYTRHPKGLAVQHQDGSEDVEVPGKASNLRWAVFEGFKAVRERELIDEEDVLVTICDADCLFHPYYFVHIAKEFSDLKRFPNNRHQMTMWQAPQLQHRNWYPSPICTRVWGVISGIFEFGGTSSLHWGAHHMVFSGYSLSLHLAMRAQPWDGDVIAEDHHAFIKCFFYSVYESALKCAESGKWCDCEAMLRVRAVFLPVKSTGIQCPQWADAWVERFHQAKRHAQGVAEIAFCLLCAWDAFWTIPLWRLPRLQIRIFRVLLHLWHMHLLPICQAACLGYLTIIWFTTNRQVEMCPDRIWLTYSREFVLCGLAGSWALVWPVAVPVVAVWFSTYLLLSFLFISPGAKKSTSLWHSEDASVPPACGKSSEWSSHLTVAPWLTLDCSMLSPVMAIYGAIPELLAYVNVFFKGNRFKYVTAAKMPVAETELAVMKPH